MIFFCFLSADIRRPAAAAAAKNSGFRPEGAAAKNPVGRRGLLRKIRSAGGGAAAAKTPKTQLNKTNNNNNNNN